MGLYLLIWGEAANVRFMPECLCYIFHNVSTIFLEVSQCLMPEFLSKCIMLNNLVQLNCSVLHVLTIIGYNL